MSASAVNPASSEPNWGVTQPVEASRPVLPIPESSLSTEPKNHAGCDITQSVVELVKDGQWLSFVTELFSATSNVCWLLSETKAAEIVPYLGIVSSPLTLYHAFAESITRIKLMVSACKTSRVADTFFWGLGSISAVGTALGNVIQPFSCGVTLFGLASLPLVKTTFTFVLPIILIACSFLGGAHQNWSLCRLELAHHKFREKKKKVHSLHEIQKFLGELKGPSKEKLSEHEFKLKDRRFEQSHFSHTKKRTAFEEHTELFFQGNSHIKANLEILLSVLQRTQEKIQTPTGNLIEDLEGALSDCDRIIEIGKERSDLPELIQARDQLLKIKADLMDQGMEMIDAVDSEMERKIAQSYIAIFSFTLSLLAGVFILINPQMKLLSTALSLSSSVLVASRIIFGKIYQQKQILEFDRFLKTVENKSKQ